LGNPPRHLHLGGSLLIVSTTDESGMSSSSVPMICFALREAGAIHRGCLMGERREYYSSRLIADPCTILVQACQSVWLGRVYDGSDAPSVSFAVGAWLERLLVQTTRIFRHCPLDGLRTSRYRRAGLFHVHLVGKEFHLPSDHELSRFLSLPAIPSLTGARFG
jgi:hypothetical protein